MATATPNLAKNPEGRGPSSAIPNKVVKTREPARYRREKEPVQRDARHGRNDGPNRDDAAEPDRERKHVHIPQRDHTSL